jgi:hypothetical protein
VGERVLPIEHLAAGRLEQLACLAAELDRDHRVVGAVSDRGRRQGRFQGELEGGHGRHEAAQRDERRRPGPPFAEAERVGHHRALREAAEHGPLGREAEAVEPLRHRGVCLKERCRIGIADLLERVPVVAAGR